MTYERFAERAAEVWDEIPATYRAGVDGVQIERGARAHPDLPGVYTLGECLTESYPSSYSDAETVRSRVVLYYGSFWRLSRQDADFDWEEELWQTLTHELQHHLESLAAEDALEDMDYAIDENFKRLEGQPFDPEFFRAGELREDGWYQVESELFRVVATTEPACVFEWDGAGYRVVVPDSAADILFLELPDTLAPPPTQLTLVVLRPRRKWQALRAAFSRSVPTVEQFEVEAEPVTS